MTDRDLMQQALDALKLIDEAMPFPVAKLTIKNLNERLAQPAQGPVAWGVFDGPNLHDMFFTEEDAQDMARLKGDGSVVKPLCTTPPAAAQRPWVSLTPKEVKEISFANRPYVVDMVVALEAKLKEKNT
tara:strand:- start:14 stop:400 length:387 start_codon:yes stop_codon:yes gene_type:complete